MSEPFISEIRMFGFDYAPKGWALCNGQILPIAQNQALYALIGTEYGGDGVSTLALPELRGRVPVHVDQRTAYAQRRGIIGGMENVPLTLETLGAHTHPMYAANENGDAGLVGKKGDRMIATSIYNDGSPVAVYGPPTSLTNMNTGTTKPIGSGEAHYNIQPSMVINFCIALQGVFPPRN